MKRSKLRRRQQWRWTPLVPVTPVPRTPAQTQKLVDHVRRVKPDMSAEAIRDLLAFGEAEIGKTFSNDRYQVHVINWPPMTMNGVDCPIVQLSIRRQDREAARDWRDFQRIKNQLVGPECEAIELYPAESRLVDTSNQFHLWCVASPDFRFPFGYTERIVDGTSSGAGDVQRPFEEQEITT